MTTPEAREHTTAADRLRLLVEAGISLSSELSLDALLQRIVETAAALTGARYAALGVVDRSGRGLERFFTTGVDPETHTAIGELPRGRGILGVVIREAKPLRLSDLTLHPASVGFPPGHPHMTTFLGVPILLRGLVYGNLYLTEKEGGEFDEEDEHLTQLLAAQAAVAIENVRLFESSTRWLHYLESLNEIAAALTSELELEPLLNMVAGRLRDLLNAKVVLIALPESEDTLRIAAAQGEGAEIALGELLTIGGSKVGRVLARKRSERLDSTVDDPEVDQHVPRALGVTSAIYTPLVVQGRALGVVVAHDKIGDDPRFEDDDVRLAESLANRAAIALDLSQRVSRDTVHRVVEAQELERKRLARELHDETGQALTSMLLELKNLERSIATDEGRERVAALRERLVETLRNVRRLAVELRPAALDDFGLAPALERLVHTYGEQSPLAVDFELQLGEGRLPSEVETTLYRIVQEALTNITKHADAAHVSIVLSRKGDVVKAVIEDDGTGFEAGEAEGHGLGLVGMRERLALVGGRLRIETAPGQGTTIAAEIPVR